MADNQQQKESLSQESYQTIDGNMTDNLINSDVILTDNTADTEVLLADSIEIQAELAEDTEDAKIANLGTVTIPERLSIAELEKRYQIKRAALYDRLSYLNIKAWREGNKAYLNAEQIAHMDGLDRHMKDKKKMDIYPKPEPTGPSDSEETSLLVSPVTAEDQAQAFSAMVLAEDSAFSLESEPTTIEPTTITSTFSPTDVEKAKLEAQRRIRANRLAVIQITRAYEEDPSKLPLEIQQEIEEAEMAAMSTPLSRRGYYDPNVLAQLAIQSL